MDVEDGSYRQWIFEVVRHKMKSSAYHLIFLSKKENHVRKLSTISKSDDMREVSGIYFAKLL